MESMVCALLSASSKAHRDDGHAANRRQLEQHVDHHDEGHDQIDRAKRVCANALSDINSVHKAGYLHDEKSFHSLVEGPERPFPCLAGSVLRKQMNIQFAV